MKTETSSARTRTRKPPEVRRAQILDAGLDAFLERGMSATTMDDVARTAGVAKGTVYLYFRSKEELVAALQARFAERLVTRARRLLDNGPGERTERLERYLSGVVDDMFDYAEVQHLLFHDAPVHGALDEVQASIRTFIERGVAAGEFRVNEPDLAARFMVDGVQGLLAQAAHEPRAAKRAVRETLLEAAPRILGCAAASDRTSVPDVLTLSQ